MYFPGEVGFTFFFLIGRQRMKLAQLWCVSPLDPYLLPIEWGSRWTLTHTSHMPLPTHNRPLHAHSPLMSALRSPGATCPRRRDSAGAHPSLHLFPSQWRMGTAFRSVQGQLRPELPGASTLGAQAGPKILLSAGEFLPFLPYLSSAGNC